MNPHFFGIKTFRELQGRLISLRLSVYEALLEHGPCTTRELSKASNIDLLTVRPRVTELVQLGFAICLDEGGHEGRYQALTIPEAEAAFKERKQREEVQEELALA